MHDDQGLALLQSLQTSQELETFPEVRALETTGVHLGFCGDQLLDHGNVAFPSCSMQRRVALARGFTNRFCCPLVK